jgi:hypothetical protein
VLLLSIGAGRWVSHALAPWRFLMAAYLILSVELGFLAPRRLLGSSVEARGEPE